ncbi:GGDEF domain-containing protein [Vibrio sp. FNV 38]|nr:GGDEF domain-containing protein [Vibrio sp. FNV 38]
MDVNTLAIYTSLLTATVASAMLLTHKYMFAGSAFGVNYIGYSALLFGVSVIPLSFGFTEVSQSLVFVSNSAYSIALGFLLAGITVLRGASKLFLVMSVVIMFLGHGFFVYSAIAALPVASRIEARSFLVVTTCFLAICANYLGTKHDSKGAKSLLNLALSVDILYMAMRGVLAHTGGTNSDYYLISNIHKFSFIVMTITIITVAFSIFWMLTERLLKQTYQSSITDEQTGLYNRRGLKELIPKLVQPGRESNISILMADLDNFKKINDTFGHDQGDDVIKHFAQIIEETCRTSDFCFRYGGEEFVVMLPRANKVQAVQVANRIRNYAKDRSCTELPSGRYTVSIGVTQAQVNDDWDSLIKRADNALYDAKCGGRDCVVHH